jgi:hypothetical protein
LPQQTGKFLPDTFRADGNVQGRDPTVPVKWGTFSWYYGGTGNPCREGSAVAQIGQPVRRYTIIPLEEPVSPTPEPFTPPPPSKSPNSTPPVIKPEPQPVE